MLKKSFSLENFFFIYLDNGVIIIIIIIFVSEMLVACKQMFPVTDSDISMMKWMLLSKFIFSTEKKQYWHVYMHYMIYIMGQMEDGD